MSWERLTETYREDGLVLAFGAGISLGSGIPAWESLLLRIAGSVAGCDQRGSEMFRSLRKYGFTLPAIASVLESRYRATRSGDFRELVREAIYRDFRFKEGILVENKQEFLMHTRENNATLAALAGLCAGQSSIGNAVARNPRIHSIVNFNLDSVFRAYVYHRHPNYVLRSIERASKAPRMDAISTYYIHGFLRFDKTGPANEGADKVVLTEKDYFDFFNKPTSLFNYTLLYLLREHSFLFVGLSMIDDNIRRLLHYSQVEREHAYGEEGRSHQSGRKALRHYAILRKEGSPLRAMIGESLEDLGVKVIWVDSFGEIPPGLRKMYEACGGDWEAVA